MSHTVHDYFDIGRESVYPDKLKEIFLRRLEASGVQCFDAKFPEFLMNNKHCVCKTKKLGLMAKGGYDEMPWIEIIKEITKEMSFHTDILHIYRVDITKIVNPNTWETEFNFFVTSHVTSEVPYYTIEGEIFES